jgi:hypothetical protein
MSKQTVYNILATKEKSMKVELSLASEFKQLYESALDKQTSVSERIVDLFGNVESALEAMKSIGPEFTKALSISEKLVSASEEIGVPVDQVTLNKIEIARREIKDVNAQYQKLKTLVKEAYNVF